MKERKYMNPYLAGFFLGMVLLFSIYITGRGLGASGAVKSFFMEGIEKIAPSHVENTKYYSDYASSHPEGPMGNWLVWEVIGVIVGAFVSGIISNRLKFKLEKGPKTSNKMRIISAIIGGLLFGLGSQFGRGCTSGAALSGMAVMSFGGIITMLAIFGVAYTLAYFFRKLWLK